MRDFGRLLSGLAAASMSTAVLAAPPDLQSGTCTYLLGAPAGGVAASDVAPVGDIIEQPTCDSTAVFAYGSPGDERAQVFITAPVPHLGTGVCTGIAWIGHQFRCSASDGPLRARIDMHGGLRGHVWHPGTSVSDSAGRIDASVVLLEADPLRGAKEELVRTTAFAMDTLEEELFLDRQFDQALESLVLPGRTYEVRLELAVTSPSGVFLVELGTANDNNGAWYDSIEVCIDAPAEPIVLPPVVIPPVIIPPDPDPRVDVAAMLDLEERLYERKCYPGVWMPVANGGLIETARQLLADRITQAVASGDPDIHERVAQMRLASADAQIAAQQYQRACRNLGDGIRALTTP